METEVTSLLASVAGGRRYWVRAPQNAAKPYVVLYRIDGIPTYTYSGRAGLIASRVQANCYGETYASAKLTAAALIAALEGANTLGDSPPGKIQAIFIESDGRDLATEDAGAVQHLFAVSVDFIVHHEP